MEEVEFFMHGKLMYNKKSSKQAQFNEFIALIKLQTLFSLTRNNHDIQLKLLYHIFISILFYNS